METNYNTGGYGWQLVIDGNARFTDAEVEQALAMVTVPAEQWSQEQLERDLERAIRQLWPGADVNVSAHPPCVPLDLLMAGTKRGMTEATCRWVQVQHADGTWDDAPDAAEVMVDGKWVALPAHLQWRCEGPARPNDVTGWWVSDTCLVWTRDMIPAVA